MTRGEVLMAGIGGMGVLVAGQLLSRAAFKRHEHASYIPSYGFVRRGGNSEYTVIFSDERISSPLLDQAQTVVLLDSSQFEAYESRVRLRGLLIVEKSGLTAERQRKDYEFHVLPAMEMAVGMGTSVLVGLIMLGACIEITRLIAPNLIEDEIRIRYADDDKLLIRNVEAFRRGLKLGEGVT